MQGERARAILRNPDFTVQGAADALGFTDPTAFHRAFRRWTGVTAVEYRNAQTQPTTGPKGKEMADALAQGRPIVSDEPQGEGHEAPDD
jgi:AraC-like DNA-binding protein